MNTLDRLIFQELLNNVASKINPSDTSFKLHKSYRDIIVRESYMFMDDDFTQTNFEFCIRFQRYKGKTPWFPSRTALDTLAKFCTGGYYGKDWDAYRNAAISQGKILGRSLADDPELFAQSLWQNQGIPVVAKSILVALPTKRGWTTTVFDGIKEALGKKRVYRPPSQRNRREPCHGTQCPSFKKIRNAHRRSQLPKQRRLLSHRSGAREWQARAAHHTRRRSHSYRFLSALSFLRTKKLHRV